MYCVGRDGQYFCGKLDTRTFKEKMDGILQKDRNKRKIRVNVHDGYQE